MPPPWTPDLVADRLVAAYRRVNVGTTSSGGFVVGDRVVSDADKAAAVEAFRWPERFVRDGRDRRYLRSWASCKASGASVREFCRDLGWPRSTAERRRLAALATIARALNTTQTCNLDLTVGSAAPEPVA